LQKVLQQLELLQDEYEFLTGDSVSLADLHAYPMLRYFRETPEGSSMLASYPGLEQWMQQMQARPSARATSFHSTGEAEDGF